MTLTAERFERRLVEEMAGLRVEFVKVEARLRQDITSQTASVRSEIASVRADLIKDGATSRTEILKWSFLFWIGQVVTIAGLLGMMLRSIVPAH